MKKSSWFLLVLFSGFCQAQSYFLNGDAFESGEDCYTLTSEVNTQNGTVWYGDQINLLQPFSIQFNMNFGLLDGNGADGICFVLQTVGTNAIGASGGGMGYLNFGTSLGIEFDTWQNGEYGDPFYDHIAIEQNGDINHNSTGNIAGPVQADVFEENIEDGENHVVRIEWDPTLESIRVYFDCVFRLQGDIDLIDDIFNGNTLVYWGFTAATGGAYNTQTVCLQPNIVNVGSEIIICQGMQPTLSVGASIDGIYNWLPTDFLNDPSSPTPVTSALSDITYTVSYVDLCGDSIEQDIFVNVEELVLSSQVIDILNCNNDDVLVEFTGNIPFEVGYMIVNEENSTIDSGDFLNDWLTDQAGSYQLLGHVDSLCFATTNFEVLSDYSTVEIESQSNVILNCFNQAVTSVVEVDVAGADINWFVNGNPQNNDNTFSWNLNQAGLYVVEATHPTSGCLSLDTIVVVSDFIEPVIVMPMQDTLSCLRPVLNIQGVQVNAAHDVSYLWSSGLGSPINGATSLSPQVSEGDVYILVATDQTNGCQASASVVVFSEELQSIDPSFLIYPNVVSPNQDNYNNVWRVFLSYNMEIPQSELFKDWELLIFDRWGHLVAENKSASQTWNATDVDEGVYFYILNARLLCGDDLDIEREGYIHVLR